MFTWSASVSAIPVSIWALAAASASALAWLDALILMGRITLTPFCKECPFIYVNN